MAHKYRPMIMEEINAAEVTGMIGNTNPDVTHTDLLMVAIRYITKEKSHQKDQ